MTRRALTQVEWVEKAKRVHGDRYDYTLVKYTHSQIKVSVICERHGEFQTLPATHLQGRGCPSCGKEKKRKVEMSTAEFISRAKQVHNGRYEYPRAVYKGAKHPVTVTCPKCDDFTVKAASHLKGRGCWQCTKMNTNNFKRESRKIHGALYDYSLVEFTGYHEPVSIVCMTHGKFEQRASSHLGGYGCQKCMGRKLRATRQKNERE